MITDIYSSYFTVAGYFLRKTRGSSLDDTTVIPDNITMTCAGTVVTLGTTEVAAISIGADATNKISVVLEPADDSAEPKYC
ncbi:hypothetical protein KKA47_04455 [bacterium]|nr:hypothetical protein [bacterium]